MENAMKETDTGHENEKLWGLWDTSSYSGLPECENKLAFMTIYGVQILRTKQTIINIEQFRARSRIKCGVRPLEKLVVHIKHTMTCFNKGCCEYNLG
jgi:hypothetical protein